MKKFDFLSEVKDLRLLLYSCPSSGLMGILSSDPVLLRFDHRNKFRSQFSAARGGRTGRWVFLSRSSDSSGG